ncbi:hypothetical protein LDL08_06320 [Nonomuraea glycinis]|uniref:Thioredoxin domain-containing protein n=1 Tax=Nonomuraea glycinis TaxID=2047744 RepID=A0A918E5H0_9ACTN|nr:hypothetical protein [Nonomuraea glycinis]MCA2175798.1 hypothetical protein [Nonomuraea glycinis]WSG71908.1 hypothetical protein OHA68_21365 [Nonomuraea glycinis]GGP05396.1 hypothetical protein GCM10012278_24760 [Nonomuraea glycinis]
MRAFLDSLTVLSFLGTVLLLFAFAAMLNMVRELQGKLLQAQAAAPAAPAVRSVDRFGSADGLPTFVLVVSEHCPNCRERAHHLAAVAGPDLSGHAVLLASADRCAEWVAAGEVLPVIDAALVGTVAVGATPTLVKYAADGTEEWRRVVGSDDDLDAFLAVSPSERLSA